MTTIPTIVVTPSNAADAYNRASRGVISDPAGASSSSFGDTVAQAVQQGMAVGRDAEAQAATAIAGGGNLTAVVTALSHAEMTLQTATAIRDRVVAAYQDIMKMPI
jgi:flagellar hook-basal body complex protein FliE